MSKLTDKIREISGSDLAREFFAAPDGQTLRREYEQGERTQEEIFDVIGNLGEYFGLFRDLSRQRYSKKFKKTKLWRSLISFLKPSIKRRNYFSNLALGVIGHDMGELMKIFYVDVGEFISNECHLRCYDQIKTALCIIPYIAFGDELGLNNLEEDVVKELSEMTVFSYGSDFATLDVVMDVPEIRSEEYWVAYQLLRNSRNAYNKINCPDKVQEHRISLKISKDYLEVEDSACGISQEVLNSIFGIYTSGGTGLGLQMVKRIVDLRDGHIIVTSTQEGEDTFQYGTRTNQVTELDKTQPRGTRFEVYLGKEDQNV
jgi:hypothetical protein